MCCVVLIGVGKGGSKAGDAKDKKNVKKVSLAKPNSIKSMFMNSNVKRPAEVSKIGYHKGYGASMCLLCNVAVQCCSILSVTLYNMFVFLFCFHRKMLISPKMTYWVTFCKTCIQRSA